MSAIEFGHTIVNDLKDVSVAIAKGGASLRADIKVLKDVTELIEEVVDEISDYYGELINVATYQNDQCL